MNTKILSLSLAGLSLVAFNQIIYAETSFSGLIEVEAAFSDEDEIATTVEFGIDHKVNDKVDGHILFLYEDDELTIDEATINLHPNETIDIIVGRQYVPFGSYDSNFITDPTTLDLGETQEDALKIAKKWGGGINTSAYVFKDDSDDANDKIDNYGVSLGYENETFSLGLGYLSDVVDTATAGFNINAKLSLDKLSVIAEHTRLEETENLNPSASHLEFAYDLGSDKTIAATYQETSDAAEFDLPKEAFGIVYSMPVYKNTSIAAEYLNTTAYDDSEDDVFTLQLAYEF